MKIDKEEVKRYLRIHGGDCGDIDGLIDSLSAKALATICPKSVANRFKITHTADGIRIDGADIAFDGNLIKKVFDGCDEIVIFVATLTVESEALLKRCFAISAVDGIVCDSVLTAMIESYCDDIDQGISKQAAEEGKTATRRISCGYGDFALQCQKDILDILCAQKFLGIKLNQNNMMYPNKTVSAVMGLKPSSCKSACDGAFAAQNKCESCASAGCDFKR